MHRIRLVCADMGRTAYYGIGDSKFRKILEMTFPNAARTSSFADGSGICGSILRIGRAAGVAYPKTVAEAMKLKLDTDNPADREKLRRAILDLVAGRKMPKQKGASLSR